MDSKQTKLNSFTHNDKMTTELQDSDYVSVFNNIINNISDYIYVTDIESKEILYMNKPMQEFYQLEEPIGKISSELLKKSVNNFCSINTLKSDPTHSFIWEEKDQETGRYYQNTDRLITWLDGRLVHLRQSNDITDFKTISQAANIDELTRLKNRRAGKIELDRMLKKASNENKTICLVLLDINGLKQTNDTYGHKEGDTKICSITQVISTIMTTKDLFYRLSGDEFVLAFYDYSTLEVRDQLSLALNKLKELKNILDIPYELSFCYGVISIQPSNPYDIDTLLTMADEKMYEQKRLNHLKHNKHLSIGDIEATIPFNDFAYDKEKLFLALSECTDDYIYVCNMKTGVFCYSQKMVDDFDLPGQVLKNAASLWANKIHPLDQANFLESNQEIIDGTTRHHCVEYRAINRHNEWIWLCCKGEVIFDDFGEPDLFAGIISHIGKKGKVDPVTGLYNKFALEEEIKSHIAASKKPLALMILNLDNFKAINQLRDYAFGDGVLKQSAKNICQTVPEDAIVYKLSGDEFAVVIHNCSVPELITIYQQIKQPFSSQQIYANERYYCSISAGCAIYPEHANKYINLFKHANYALETSKKSGKNQLNFFSDQIISDHLRKLTLTEQLRESINNNFDGFSLRYQPIVDTFTQKIIGAEALMRWISPTYGPISPVEFIPLLEESRLIIEAGRWIIREAIYQTKHFIMINPDFNISINLSYVQTSPIPITPFIKQVLKESQINPHNVIVEFTESYIALDNIVMIHDSLRELGLRIAMDDFGTGYSSLSTLKHCPADIVKIDKSFVENITDNHFDVKLIHLIIELCHEINILVCLEGVEEPQEYDIIKQLGPDYIQGFLFGKPCSEDELIYLLNKQ